jgi:hypothetical protein
MRRLTLRKALLAALAAALMLAPAGCKRREKVSTETIEEPAPTLASVVHMADPKIVPQLLRGFHGVEGNAWRWTMGKFAVTLRPPLNAPQKGATLVAKFAIPDAVMSRTKSVTLSASVNGVSLAPETFTKTGDFVYSRDVAATALTAEAVTAEFALDSFLPSGAVEQRELGLVVSSIGFEAK